MPDRLEFGGVEVDVLRKDIKHLHLSVHPPTGRVRIAAPSRMSLEAIRVYAVSKLPWIRRHQTQLREQERETPREFLPRESHHVWGRRYLLELRERLPGRPAVEISHNRLLLRLPAESDTQRRQTTLETWYRLQVHEAAPPLIDRWSAKLGVRPARFFVQHMKTKWGSCNPKTGTIRLNTELARKPPVCLEYLVVHELMHLIEPTHGPHFVELMDRHLPKWRFYRDELNRLPMRHEDWVY